MKLQKINILVFFLLIFFEGLNAQVISSEAATIRINNISAVKKSPPEIKLISPAIAEGMVFKTSEAQLNLIGKATDEEGIISVIVNSSVAQFSETGVFTSTIALVPGSNEVKVIAMDGGDNFAEHTFRIDYAPKVLSFGEKVANESKYYGLIIGVEDYKDPDIKDLDHPIRDAQSLYNVLTKNYTFEKENISFIKNATREDILTAFEDLSKKVTEKDNLLIFYAGHGWWDQTANNGYWLPSDAKDDNKLDWFRNSTLVDYLKEVKSKHTLIITDACFGGAIFKSRSAFSDAPKSIELLYDLKSRKAMTSGTLTEVPDESAFIKYLVERLEENKSAYLNSEELFSSFRTAVMNNSEVVPQYGEIRNVGDEGGEFIFIKR